MNQETKDKLREEYKNDGVFELNFGEDGDSYFEAAEKVSNWWLSKFDSYTTEVFTQEANRNKGMIKVRGRNGVTMMTKEQLAELDKSNG